MRQVTSWGQLISPLHDVVDLYDGERVSRQLRERKTPTGLAFGMGRSYGDVCLNPNGTLWRTTGMDRFIAFDPLTGRLVCEAGVRLGDIQRIFVPRGWILPVTPGTQYVTVGGAIANDVHGKNHHARGSFGNHVLGLTLARTDGEVISCGPGHNSDWFSATVGGLGLTGVIVSAELQLMPVPGPWIYTEIFPFTSLQEYQTLQIESDAHYEYTVAWIDCLSSGPVRGIFFRGKHAPNEKSEPKPKNLSMPATPPISLINTLSTKIFNKIYFYLKSAAKAPFYSHYKSFFYPLDGISNWNRIYGTQGFYQYQCIIPTPHDIDGISLLIKEIGRHQTGSFLAVLKSFGTIPSTGMMSFPKAGLTLALDFPNHGKSTLDMFTRLDRIVGEMGGRLYFAKDARMPKSLAFSGYPRLEEFARYRDPGIDSALARRLIY